MTLDQDKRPAVGREPHASPATLRIEEFDYPLPDSMIARHPIEPRDSCKLLMRDHDGALSEHVFTDLPGLLPDKSEAKRS